MNHGGKKEVEEKGRGTENIVSVICQKVTVAQSAGAVEYTDPPTNECPGYDTKQSDGEVPAVL